MTNFQRNLFRVLPLLVAQLFVTAARADELENIEAPVARDASNFGLGVVVGSRQRPYKGLDSDTRVLPLISYENSWVRLQGLGATFKLGSVENFSFGLRIDRALNGYKASDAPILAGMEDRKASFWAGPSVQWRTGYVNLSGEASADVSGKSKGTQLRFSADHMFRTGRFGFTPRVSVAWLDRKSVDYYYGVRASEATQERSAYDGSSTANVGVGLRSDFLVAPRQSIFLDLSATRLGNAIKNSPLVDKSTQSGFLLGYLYRF